MDEQRKRVYGYRQRILDGANCKPLILDMIAEQVQRHLEQCLARDYGTETFSEWAGKQLDLEFDARDFRGMDFEAASLHALDQAEHKIEGQVLDAIEENLPEEADPREWNWEALAKMANVRWHLNLRERDLKQVGRDGVGELLIEKARAALGNVDLSDGAVFLAPDFGAEGGLRLGASQVQYFAVAGGSGRPGRRGDEDLGSPAGRGGLSRERGGIPGHGRPAHFTAHDPGGHKRYDREGLVAWAAQRFHVDAGPGRPEEQAARRDPRPADRAEPPLQRHGRRGPGRDGIAAGQVFNGEAPSAKMLRDAFQDGRLASLAGWAAERFNSALTPEKMVHMSPEGFQNQLANVVEDQVRPEMRKMERALLLNLLDMAWKEHLLSMDHLRSSVGLRGYAQIDPKVEFKREGMRIFAEMWESIGERVTDLIFRMEQLDEDFRRLDLDRDRSHSRGRLGRRRHCPAAERGHRGHSDRPQTAADPQPAAARRTQRSVSLRQRQEVQELLHKEVTARRQSDVNNKS